MKARLTSASSRLACIAVVLLLLSQVPLFAQIHYATEMTTAQYRDLDRNKTVVVLTSGILEEHGPYLPAYTDGYIAERIVQDVADAVVAKNWQVLVFPTIPLGAGGANELAARYPFPGSFTVRLATLRAVFMDLAYEIGDAGFRWIFVVSEHGAPNQNRALDQACEFFNETFAGGHMVVLRGLSMAASAQAQKELQNTLSDQARAEDASSGHAGIDETSLMLFMQRKLVDPGFKSAPAFTVRGFDMSAVAKLDNWPGYFGSPRFSTATYGAGLYQLQSSQAVEQALKTLDGTAPPPSRTTMTLRTIDTAAMDRDAWIEKKQQEWLNKKSQK